MLKHKEVILNSPQWIAWGLVEDWLTERQPGKAEVRRMLREAMLGSEDGFDLLQVETP